MNPTLAMALERMKQCWAEDACDARPPATDADIQTFERLYDIRIPEDVLSYFRCMDGMNEAEYDRHCIRFWPLAELKPAAAELPESDPQLLADYFVFADYSLWAHAYAVRMANGPSDVVIVGAAAPIHVASTFAEFLQTYTDSPERLF